jgi:F0F1-type ATP synthase membrane subunit b/b'
LKKARATLRREIVSLSTEMAEKVLRKKLNRKEDEAYVDSILKDVEKV